MQTPFLQAVPEATEAKTSLSDLSVLLKWVTEGHLEEVEKLLEKNPSLGLGMGTVTDRSGRTFKNITVLQYAAWALDVEMVALIMKYVEGRASALQLKALESEPKQYSEYGVSYDFKALVNKYQEYLDNCGSWDDDKCAEYWQKEIGGEQRKCPAWLIYAWSEEGYKVAWTKRDETQKVKREYDKHRLEFWFAENLNEGSGVGRVGGFGRGEAKDYLVRLSAWLSHKSKLSLDWMYHDQECVLLLGKSHYETLGLLKNKVEGFLVDNSLTPSLKQ